MYIVQSLISFPSLTVSVVVLPQMVKDERSSRTRNKTYSFRCLNFGWKIYIYVSIYNRLDRVIGCRIIHTIGWMYNRYRRKPKNNRIHSIVISNLHFTRSTNGSILINRKREKSLEPARDKYKFSQFFVVAHLCIEAIQIFFLFFIWHRCEFFLTPLVVMLMDEMRYSGS